VLPLAPSVFVLPLAPSFGVLPLHPPSEWLQAQRRGD
jgi:hypothetical protein